MWVVSEEVGTEVVGKGAAGTDVMVGEKRRLDGNGGWGRGGDLAVVGRVPVCARGCVLLAPALRPGLFVIYHGHEVAGHPHGCRGVWRKATGLRVPPFSNAAACSFPPRCSPPFFRQLVQKIRVVPGIPIGISGGAGGNAAHRCSLRARQHIHESALMALMVPQQAALIRVSAGAGAVGRGGGGGGAGLGLGGRVHLRAARPTATRAGVSAKTSQSVRLTKASRGADRRCRASGDRQGEDEGSASDASSDDGAIAGRDDDLGKWKLPDTDFLTGGGRARLLPPPRVPHCSGSVAPHTSRAAVVSRTPKPLECPRC